MGHLVMLNNPVTPEHSHDKFHNALVVHCTIVHFCQWLGLPATMLLLPLSQMLGKEALLLLQVFFNLVP